ncbi:MAG TPA: alpha/beta fold hydrolase, partial [Acidimicrobiales bacterium]|nr:alpha/beta fold hydrolase [Acidimicrobiales bacterium]
SWRHVAPRLTDAGYRVLAPDQRGYAADARPTRRRDYTLDKLAADVLALAEDEGVARFHVVGHDWGGAVAWYLAANHAERLITMTSLATPHPKAMVASLLRGQLLKSWYMLAFQLPVLPELALRGPFFRRQLLRTGMPGEFVDEYLALLREPGAARGALNWYRALPFSPPSNLGVSHVPTLYIYGTGDIALDRHAADRTGDYVDAPYRYEVLDGVSHWIPEEVPERVAALVLDFIREVAVDR